MALKSTKQISLEREHQLAHHEVMPFTCPGLSVLLVLTFLGVWWLRNKASVVAQYLFCDVPEQALAGQDKKFLQAQGQGHFNTNNALLTNPSTTIARTLSATTTATNMTNSRSSGILRRMKNWLIPRLPFWQLPWLCKQNP